MIVEYSKSFQKSVDKLSGKTLDTIIKVILEIKSAEYIEEINDCKKLTGFDNVYRIRIGDYRAFFTFHVSIEGKMVKFEYLIARGQVYNKKNISVLRKKD